MATANEEYSTLNFKKRRGQEPIYILSLEVTPILSSTVIETVCGFFSPSTTSVHTTLSNTPKNCFLVFSMIFMCPHYVAIYKTKALIDLNDH
jgi:hypothetical protein